MRALCVVCRECKPDDDVTLRCMMCGAPPPPREPPDRPHPPAAHRSTALRRLSLNPPPPAPADIPVLCESIIQGHQDDVPGIISVKNDARYVLKKARGGDSRCARCCVGRDERGLRLS